MLQKFFYTLPQICASIQSCLGGLQTIPWTSWLGLCSDMQLTVGPFIDRCVPFQIMSNQTEFTTGGLQSSSRNISRMISGNRMHLSSILSVMEKAVNTYVHVIFSFFFLINLQIFQTNFLNRNRKKINRNNTIIL